MTVQQSQPMFEEQRLALWCIQHPDKAAARIEELEAALRWIEARDRMWTSPEYEKGNEVLDRADHNIRIRGPYGAVANLVLKGEALPQPIGVARAEVRP